MLEAGDAAARLVLEANSFTESDWEAMIDYLQDEWPEKYGDMDIDELEELNKRMVAEMILKRLLNVKDDARVLGVRPLASEWRQRQAAKKRKRPQDVVPFDRRAREEEALRSNPDRLTGCQRGGIPYGVTIQVDESLAGYSVIVPEEMYSDSIIELQQGTVRAFARIQAPHTADFVGVSPRVALQLNVALPTLLRACTGAYPVQRIRLRFYGTPEEWRNERIVPQHFVDELRMMPMISLGQTFTAQNDPNNYIMRIEALSTVNDRPVFMAQMPGPNEEREIEFIFEPETPDLVGCHLCGTDSAGNLFCSEQCVTDASMMNCAVCGDASTHTCSGCRAIGFCSSACWADSSHSMECTIDAAVKRGREDEEGDDETPSRLRRTAEPPGYDLSQQMRERAQNPRFIQNYLAEHGTEHVRLYVVNAEDGLEGALNRSNLFWYYVRQKMLLEQPYNATINYRVMIVGQ